MRTSTTAAGIVMNTDSNDRSYGRILKTTFIMGVSSVITTILGIVRVKIIALMLGPSGMGLTGIYMTITSVVTAVSGMGIRESGVRQIAEAAGTGDCDRISRTAGSLRRAALLSGIAGLIGLLLLSGKVSELTFGSRDHGYDIALLSLATLFGAVSGGQTALIQGMRRVRDLAKVTVLGALMGTISSVPVIYFWGESGIASYLVIVAATGVLTSWWFSRRIASVTPSMSWNEALSEAKPLMRLGSALMLGALLTPCTQYLVRTFIVRNEGLSAAGIYHASTTLSVIYVHVILNAMITDFYPRLSQASNDNTLCRSLINDQIEVGLLLAVPGILAIMTFTPLVITVLYSTQFMAAVDILRWQILGVMLQVVAWPMGFMLRAKGRGKMFLSTELFASAVNLTLSWGGLAYFGLVGIGMAYFGMNVCYVILIYLIDRKYFQFSLEKLNIQLLTGVTIMTVTVFLTPLLVSMKMSIITNTCIVLIASVYSFKTLVERVDSKTSGLLLKIRRLLTFRTGDT